MSLVGVNESDSDSTFIAALKERKVLIRKAEAYRESY